MRKLIYIASSVVVLIIASQFTACIKCGPFDVKTFKVTEFGITSTTTTNLSIDTTKLDTATMLNAMYFKINPVHYYYVSNKSNHYQGLISTAFACSPPSNYSVDKITQIEIYPSQDISTTITTETDLSSYIQLSYPISINEDYASSLSLYPYRLFTDYSNIEYKPLRFLFKVHLSDGRILSSTSNQIYFPTNL